MSENKPRSFPQPRVKGAPARPARPARLPPKMGGRFPTFFFLNKELHRKIGINRANDTIITWNYPQECKRLYNYSDTVRRKEPAFKTSQVCDMINRRRWAIEMAIVRGNLKRPQHSTKNYQGTKRIYAYWWHEDDILAVLEYFSTIQWGKKRKDGLITSVRLPTPREIRARVRNEEILYIREGDTFVPTWKAKEI